MPAKKKTVQIIEGSCNTCKYRVNVPKDPTSRELNQKRKPSCCFGETLDFKTDKKSHECALYTYSDYYIRHPEEFENEV